MRAHVFKRVFITLILFCGSVALVHAKAASPVFIEGPECPAGSARTRPWILFEDRDGDGYHDFMVAGDCDGTVRGRPWNPIVQSDPWIRTAADATLGQLPLGETNIAPDYSFQEEASGFYSWIVAERRQTGVEVCLVERNADRELATTCTSEDLE